MAFRKVQYANGVNGVNAGQTATITIPPGDRLHELPLFVSNNGSADYSKVKEVRLSVGSQLMQKMTAGEIVALYQEKFNTANDGHLPIMFSELSRANINQQEITAWDLDGEGVLTVQVDFDATAVNPGLKIAKVFDNSAFLDNRTGQKIKRPIKRLPIFANPAAGWFDITNIPNESPIAAIRIDTTTSPTPGDIEAFEVLRGSEKVLEGTWTENRDLLEAMGYDATQFVLPIIFDRDHQIENALDCRTFDAKGNVTGVLPLTVRVKMASAKGIKILVDQIRTAFN